MFLNLNLKLVKLKSKLKIVGLRLVFLTFSLAVLGSQASALVAVNGVSVSPATEQLSLSTGLKSTSFKVFITNHNKQIISVTLATENFSSLNDSGGLSFNPKDISASHSLAKYISFSHNNLVIGPNQSQSILVTIKNINQLAYGGHYVAIIYKVNSPSPVKTQSSLSVNEALASLVFVSTASGGSQSVKLLSLPETRFYVNFPQVITSVFKDTGNTQTSLHGLIRIYNSHHKLISQGFINTNSALILPGSSRLFETSLSRINQPGFLPSKYSINFSYANSGSSLTDNYQATFYYVNKLAIALLIFVVILVLIALRLIFKKLRKTAQKKSQVSKQADTNQLDKRPKARKIIVKSPADKTLKPIKNQKPDRKVIKVK
jgi:hypothetical protein